MPVTLGFADHGFDAVWPEGVRRFRGQEGTLHIAQVLPPPYFGEVALVETELEGQRAWQHYSLDALGDEGRALHARLAAALRELAAPAEWWPLDGAMMECRIGIFE